MKRIFKNREKQETAFINTDELEKIVREHFTSQGKIVKSIDNEYTMTYYEGEDQYFSGLNIIFEDKN